MKRYFDIPVNRYFAHVALVSALLLISSHWWPLDVSPPGRRAGTALSAVLPGKTTTSPDDGPALARPLFHENRRPAVAVPKAVAVPAAAPKPVEFSYDLSGVMRSRDGGYVAYLSHRTSAETVSVRMGDTVEGWTVETISERAVTVQIGKRQVVREIE